jgi:hypothetical protein
VVLVVGGATVLLPNSQEFRNLVSSNLDPSSSPKICSDPPARLEWRQLRPHEKREYISAVKCLQSTQSEWHLNDTLYDDFPRLHQLVGTFGTYICSNRIGDAEVEDGGGEAEADVE